MGQREDLPQEVITPSIGPRRVLAELLFVDVHRIRYMFVPGGLDLRGLLHFTRGAVVGSTARTVGDTVCCFATLLFVSGDLVVDTAIILAVRQALWGRSIATMVLAETLNGLDVVAAGGEFIRGASIIVYMWLLERHRFVRGSQTRIGILHTPGLFFRRSIPYSFTRIPDG